MMQNAPVILDTNFKDDAPLNTVNRIKQMLKEYGIETEEIWGETGVPNCYSLRVSVFGTVFGVNGKGVTPELTLASGYGELMERLQLGRIFAADRQKESGSYAMMSENIRMTAQELLERNRKWYALYVDKLREQTGKVMTAEAILAQYCDADGTVAVTPFYCVNTQTQEYLPTALLDTVYSTNGCAAGNSMEEAVVQAISEIAERYYSTRVLYEEIKVPDIPDEILKKCTIAYQIITYLRERGFRVTVKDCSLGTKFPVVCVCLIDQKTGRYHTHFGAYPNFEIALQRTLTESFQGRNIEKVAQFENFFRKQNASLDVANMLNQLVYGAAEKKPEFFATTSELEKITCGFSGKNNRDFLKECIDFYSEQGFDILVRDHSCLGFPTYQVIIPGYSEVFVHRMDPSQNLRYQGFVQAVLRDPANATTENIMGFMMNLTEMAKRKMSQPTFSAQANLPVQLTGTEEQYLWSAAMACLNYKMGRTGEVIKYVERVLQNCGEEEKEQLICLKRYLTLSADGYEPEQIRGILANFHQPETIAQLYSAAAENKNLLERYALRCDLQCQPNCKLYGRCLKKQTDALAKLVAEKQKQMDHSVSGKEMARLLEEKA